MLQTSPDIYPLELALQPRQAATHCSYCAVQCAMELSETPLGTVEAKGLPHPVNAGKLCVLGQSSAALLNHTERLTQPLVRINGDLTPVSWDVALAYTASGFERIRTAHGAAANGVYSGASITNEKAYLLGKFARVALSTPNVDYNGRYCMSSAATAANRAFGLDRGLNEPFEALAGHDLIVIVGGNVAECLPIMMNHLLDAKKAGTRFLVIDPRRTITANLASLHLSVKPGGDLALATGLLKIVLDNGQQNERYIAERATGFEAVAASLRDLELGQLAEDAGLTVAELEAAAALLTDAKSPLITTGRGNDQNSRGVDTTLAWINLSLALGAGYGTLTGQANGQGGREHGMKADQLPGYRSITNPKDRQAVAAVWGVDEADLPGPGLSAYELLQAAGRGEVKGLFVLGSNPVSSSPNARKVQEHLEGLEHLVVVDSFLSETARLAHVVLPGSLWAEEAGTTTNLEGRVLLRHALRPPPPGARRDIDVVQDLAARLGAGEHFNFADAESIFNELRRATAGAIADYSGITYGRLRAGEALFWPCPSHTPGDAPHPGTPKPFETRFAHPDGRARFHAVTVRPPAEVPDAEFPFALTTGRVRFHYLTGNHTRRTKILRSKAPEPVLELHPEAAATHGLEEGHLARVTTRRGHAVFKVKLSEKIRPDTLFVPFHWAVVNTLTNDALDPHSKMPEFKVCAAALEPNVSADEPHKPAIR